MSNNYTGSNARQGKRKRTSGPREMLVSRLSRKLFFKGPRPAVPQMSSMVFDKAVGRALKARMITPPEQKFRDTISTDAIISTTETVVLLNGLVLGTTDETRVGTKIRVTKVELNGFIQLSGVAGGGLDVGKISLFVHKQVNGATTAFSVLGTSATPAPYNDNGNAVCLKNGNNADDYYIIKDWDYSLDSNAGVSGAWQFDTLRIKCEVPINRVVVFNNGNAGTVADIISNAFYLGTLGSHVAGASQTSFQYFARVWYTDV